MNKKTIFTSVITLSLVIAFSGCANVDGEPTLKSSSNTSIMPSEISNSFVDSSLAEDENSLHNNQVEYPMKCKVYNQTTKIFTEEQLLSFFSEKPTRSYNDITNTAIYESETERGNTRLTNLNFSTDAGVLCMMAYGETYGEGIYTNDDELDNVSREATLEKVKNLMMEFGFSPEDWFVSRLYSINANLLNSFKEKTYKSLTESLDENPYSLDESEIEEQINQAERIQSRPSKDFYYIDIRFKIDEIPVYPEGTLYRGEGYSVSPSSCQICFSKDGIEYISISNVHVTKSSEEVKLMEFDEARELISKKYNEIIFEGEVEVNDMELVYIPIPQNGLDDYGQIYETYPFYAFRCKITEVYNGENLVTNNITYFDAVTGKEFATEQLSAHTS